MSPSRTCTSWRGCVGERHEVGTTVKLNLVSLTPEKNHIAMGGLIQVACMGLQWKLRRSWRGCGRPARSGERAVCATRARPAARARERRCSISRATAVSAGARCGRRPAGRRSNTLLSEGGRVVTAVCWPHVDWYRSWQHYQISVSVIVGFPDIWFDVVTLSIRLHVGVATCKVLAQYWWT